MAQVLMMNVFIQLGTTIHSRSYLFKTQPRAQTTSVYDDDGDDDDQPYLWCQ